MSTWTFCLIRRRERVGSRALRALWETGGRREGRRGFKRRGFKQRGFKPTSATRNRLQPVEEARRRIDLLAAGQNGIETDYPREWVL